MWEQQKKTLYLDYRMEDIGERLAYDIPANRDFPEITDEVIDRAVFELHYMKNFRLWDQVVEVRDGRNRLIRGVFSEGAKRLIDAIDAKSRWREWSKRAAWGND